MNRGTSRAVSGTISATSETAISARAVRGASLVIAKPAHDATRSVSGTVTAATTMEFTTYRPRSTSSKARSYAAVVGGHGTSSAVLGGEVPGVRSEPVIM